ncbi:TIR domain-containing protein [Rubrivivax albus]|uniref:TIR domain-containing protein n=1 Tax=Rubrivivax albus TaxID=2499835 RepID=A0A3S3SEP8_9BURK|nr:TIR domain-containing protein [Rubrivivax albus]RVT53783.1 TIR domain-containing protein [Rubrivivax albus]
MAAEVFLSYARRAHRAEARALHDALAAAGVTVFLDEQDIADGAAFPAAIGAALMAARVAVVFAGVAYFQRPWCVHEFRLLTSGWRLDPSPPDSAPDLSDAVVVALPTAGDVEAVVAQLPPALAAVSWPAADRADALAALVRARLQGGDGRSIGERLAALADDTLVRLRSGADQPLPWAAPAPAPAEPAAPVWLTDDMPVPRGADFHGRALLLWRLVHEAVSARAYTPARRVVLQGLGGSGKSLCAAEFVARHARRAFPGGVVWVDAAAGPDALVAAGLRLWAALGPEPTSALPDDAAAGARWQALSAPLAARLQARVAAGSMLWVIDNLPEPGAGKGGIGDWCPAPRHLSVLVTTRRSDVLRDSDATLTIGPLDVATGLALLTAPPVQPGWLPAERWAAVVRWVGGLPLALTVLRAALLDGGLAVAELAALPEGEPAAETERLMQALRGEVDDTALRGAAEAFGLALQALQNEPGLASAALTLALLAPVALGEPLPAAAVGTPAVGRLARRGWLQPAGDAHTRRFTLHRVPASVLRHQMSAGPDDAADAAIAAALGGLAAVAGDADARVALHLDAVMRRLVRRGQAGASVFDAARRLLQAVFSQPTGRGLRFVAAQAAGVMGLGADLVGALRAAHDNGDDAATEALPHTLQALPREPAAMAWLAELLRDRRPRVRWQAMAHAPPVEALVQPALAALLDGTSDRDTGFYDGFLREPALLRAVLPALLDTAAHGHAAQRRIVHALCGKLLAAHGRAFEAGGFSGAALRRWLLNHALKGADADAAGAAAAALAAGDAPFDDESWPALCAAVDAAAADDALRIARLGLVRRYLDSTRHSAPRDVRVERDDEGGVRVSGQFFQTPDPWPPAVVPRLIGWVVDGPQDSVAAAAALLVADDQGLHDASDWAHAQVDAGHGAAVRRLADAVLALGDVGPRAVNVRWWRARAALADGDPAAAVPDLEAVLEAQPGFDEARLALADACLTAGEAAMAAQDGAAVLAWGRRAEAAKPDAVGAQQMQAVGHHLLGDYAGAEAAASRVIAARPDDGQGWWLRALSLLAMGQRDDARADAAEALRLAPDDPRFAALAADLAGSG